MIGSGGASVTVVEPAQLAERVIVMTTAEREVSRFMVLAFQHGP